MEARTTPFRIVVPGADYRIETHMPSHTHVVLTEHDADDNPRSSTKFVTAHECRIHVLDLVPCSHGWHYDAFSKALATDDADGIVAHAPEQA